MASWSPLLLAAACLTAPALAQPFDYDVLVRGGLVYDGTGAAPRLADVGLRGDRVVAVGSLSGATAREVVEARGLAVAPGFINVLSWATETLMADGRALSDLRQGVTLEVFGEGWSMGPLSDAMKAEMVRDAVAEYGSAAAAAEALGLAYREGEPLQWPWTTLGEYLDWVAQRGVAVNVASFVGATTVRIHELGYADRAPTPDELTRMRALVRQAMEEGALGVGSSLIYAPAFYAGTDELVALAQEAARYDGRYISHLRSEGNRFLEALDELLAIARRAGIGAEVYHLKAAGRDNWNKLEAAIARIEAARAEGLDVTANMYTYTAGATGLDAAMPPWVQEGGYDAWAARLRDPALRLRVAEEMRTPTDAWENLMRAAGPEGTLLVGFRQDSLRHLAGKTLAEVAALWNTSPEEAAMDLVVADGTRVGTIYFLMSEENVRRQIQLPWMAFGSDAGAVAPEGRVLQTMPHPRAYGTFARLLGRYVREEGLVPLEEAIRRLTSFPADNLRLAGRGRLAPGAFADVVVFDPAAVEDRATFAQPHQLAVGVEHVYVNGVRVLSGGEPTGALPGRVVHGPGRRR